VIKDRALEGKVALVTGASRGIGRATAIALGARGAHVVINYHSREDAALSAAQAVRDAGGEAELAQFDLAQVAAVEEAIKRVADARGRLDIAVCNAGIAIDQLLLRLKTEDWQRSIDVNLTGVFACATAASRHLLKAKEGGRLITLTSIVGETGSAGQAAYVAAKAGVIGLTKTLAREFASRGVTVNAVSPGFIDTDMTAAAISGDARERLIATIPLGRMGKAEDCADAVAWLAGPEAAYMTGQVIRINGGLLM
jgi:3-oxoacyl-[acyl-carrier protein] reductase